MQTISKKHMRRWFLPGLLGLILRARIPSTYTATIEAGFSPKGTALQLILKTIETVQQKIRLMGYSFTSPEVTWALVRAKRRGVNVGVILDWRVNTGRSSNASKTTMSPLVSASIPVHTVSAYKILHDKMIVIDGRNTQTGLFSFSRVANRSDSKNVLVVQDDLVLARSYLNRWTSRWTQGTDWERTY